MLSYSKVLAIAHFFVSYQQKTILRDMRYVIEENAKKSFLASRRASVQPRKLLLINSISLLLAQNRIKRKPYAFLYMEMIKKVSKLNRFEQKSCHRVNHFSLKYREFF